MIDNWMEFENALSEPPAEIHNQIGGIYLSMRAVDVGRSMGLTKAEMVAERNRFSSARNLRKQIASLDKKQKRLEHIRSAEQKAHRDSLRRTIQEATQELQQSEIELKVLPSEVAAMLDAKKELRQSQLWPTPVREYFGEFIAKQNQLPDGERDTQKISGLLDLAESAQWHEFLTLLLHEQLPTKPEPKPAAKPPKRTKASQQPDTELLGAGGRD